MASRDTLEYPGLFASVDEAHKAQQAAVRFANSTVKDAPNADAQRAQIIADERELRARRLLRSAVLWAVIGIPLCLAVASIVLFIIAGILGAIR